MAQTLQAAIDGAGIDPDKKCQLGGRSSGMVQKLDGAWMVLQTQRGAQGAKDAVPSTSEMIVICFGT